MLQTHCAEGARIHTGSFLQNSVHSVVVLDTAVSQQRGVLDAPVRSVPEAGIRHADCMRWASLSDPFQCSAVGHCLPVLETLDVASLELCSTRTTLPRADRARPTRLRTVLSPGPISIAAHKYYREQRVRGEQRVHTAAVLEPAGESTLYTRVSRLEVERRVEIEPRRSKLLVGPGPELLLLCTEI